MKPIVIKDGKTEYTLEFNRETIKFAESRGFKIENVSDFPMTFIPDLFYYAFRMHHKNLSREKTDKILFEEMGGIPADMLTRLCELYVEPFNALTVMEDSEPKNSKWTVEM